MKHFLKQNKHEVKKEHQFDPSGTFRDGNNNIAPFPEANS